MAKRDEGGEPYPFLCRAFFCHRFDSGSRARNPASPVRPATSTVQTALSYRSLMASRARFSALAFNKLNALDKRSGGAASSGRGGVHAETDPGNAGGIVLAEVALESGVEVKFGHYGLAGFRFTQANEAAAGMKVPSFIREIDLLV